MLPGLIGLADVTYKASKTSSASMRSDDSSSPAGGSSSGSESEPQPTLNGSDSHDESSDGSYMLSTCCVCGQLEDRSADIPILLCDGCDNECHLTCARDRPKLTRVPEGNWYCSNCVRKQEQIKASEKGVDLEKVPFDQLEEAYNRRKRRKELMEVLESAPFDMLEEVYKKKKRLTSTINLTSDDFGDVQSDGSGAALQSQIEQQHALLNVKKEQANEISHLKGKIEEEKKTSAAHQLNLERIKECVNCMEEDKCVALFPCSHLALCKNCQNLVEDCPICRKKIEERRTIKVA